jgi:hypothetical protein
MSYEGILQLLCTNGHYWTINFREEDLVIKCPICSEPVVFRNSVDNTNGDSWGMILMEHFLKTPEVKQTCNLGHEHVVQAATYQIPTREERNQFRCYIDWKSEKMKFIVSDLTIKKGT